MQGCDNTQPHATTKDMQDPTTTTIGSPFDLGLFRVSGWGQNNTEGRGSRIKYIVSIINARAKEAR